MLYKHILSKSNQIIEPFCDSYPNFRSLSSVHKSEIKFCRNQLNIGLQSYQFKQMENQEEKNDVETCSTAKDSELSFGQRVYTLPEEFDAFFIKHSEKQPFFEDTDWNELQGNVLEWFKKKGVLHGHPENVKVQVLCTSKRKIVLKRQETQNNRLLQSFGRRFTDKLTVSI